MRGEVDRESELFEILIFDQFRKPNSQQDIDHCDRVEHGAPVRETA